MCSFQQLNYNIGESMDDDDISGMINLTPLLDVLFVILILFIMIAPMLEFDRIALASGTEKRSTLQENREIKIVVDHTGNVRINGRDIPLKLVELEARNLFEKGSTLVPALYHDEAAPFGTYQSIKNAFENAGFANLDVVLKP